MAVGLATVTLSNEDLSGGMSPPAAGEWLYANQPTLTTTIVTVMLPAVVPTKYSKHILDTIGTIKTNIQMTISFCSCFIFLFMPYF